MESRAIEQDKFPDVVFKHHGHYYIFELKMMKGSGGGQNKQAVEFAYFIRFSEANDKIHYGILLDCLYSNDLFASKQPKIVSQRRDVIEALDHNPGILPAQNYSWKTYLLITKKSPFLENNL